MTINRPRARHLESMANNLRALLNMRDVANSIHVRVVDGPNDTRTAEVWNGDKGVLATTNYKHAMHFLNGIAYGHNLTL